MLRQLIIVLITVAAASCSHTRTADGQIRFKPSRFTVKPNEHPGAYTIIDTGRIYRFYEMRDTALGKAHKPEKPSYLKFYGNGRYGEFRNYNPDDITSLLPGKAKMGYYNYNGEKFVVQEYFKHPQSGGLSKYEVQKAGDTLLLIKKKNIDERGYVLKFVAEELPEQFLRYKPDW